MYCANDATSFDAQAERERQAELRNTRYDELASFKEFLRTDGCLMKYIADELDAPDAKEHCGICANCTGEPLFPVEGWTRCSWTRRSRSRGTATAS